MSDSGASETTRADVEQLWSEALADAESHKLLRQRVLAQLERADAENPVVSWGLNRLDGGLYLGFDIGQLAEAHAIWLEELRAFDADPAAWMTH